MALKINNDIVVNDDLQIPVGNSTKNITTGNYDSATSAFSGGGSILETGAAHYIKQTPPTITYSGGRSNYLIFDQKSDRTKNLPNNFIMEIPGNSGVAGFGRSVSQIGWYVPNGFGSGREATKFDLSPDGLHWYIGNDDEERILYYTNSVPWGVSTVSYDDDLSTTAQFRESAVSGRTTHQIRISEDGYWFYILEGPYNNPYSLHQYSLSTAFDLGTASHDSTITNFQMPAIPGANSYLNVNLVTNGTFSDGTFNPPTGWTVPTGSWGNNGTLFTSVNTGATCEQTITTEVGKLYIVDFNVTQNYSSTTNGVYILNPDNSALTDYKVNNQTGAFSFTFTATNTTHKIRLLKSSNNGTLAFDNIKVTKYEYTPDIRWFEFRRDGKQILVSGTNYTAVLSLSEPWDYSSSDIELQSYGNWNLSHDPNYRLDPDYKRLRASGYDGFVNAGYVTTYEWATPWYIGSTQNDTFVYKKKQSTLATYSLLAFDDFKLRPGGHHGVFLFDYTLGDRLYKYNFQDSAGHVVPESFTFPPYVHFEGGAAPDFPLTGETLYLEFMTPDSGDTYYAKELYRG